MQLGKVDISGELRVTYENAGSEVWDRQIDLMSNATKVRIMNDFYELYWYDLTNGTEYGGNVGVDIPVTNIFVGVGDGVDTTFSGTLGPLPIKPGTTTFNYTIASAIKTATTNASGVVTGNGITSGSVNQTTGAYTLEYSTAPDSGTAITAGLTRGAVTDDSIVTGFTFQLVTDEAPVLNEGLFMSPIAITVAPQKIDRYEQNDYIIYEATMTGTYTGADTAPVTAVGLHYIASSGNSGTANVADNFLIKSTAPLNNPIYGAGGLVLSNASTVTVVYRIKVNKK